MERKKVTIEDLACHYCAQKVYDLELRWHKGQARWRARCRWCNRLYIIEKDTVRTGGRG